MVGLILAMVGVVGVVGFGLMALLTANPCGPFADSCDEYGTTPPISLVMANLAFYSVLLGLIGLVVTVVGAIIWFAGRPPRAQHTR